MSEEHEHHTNYVKIWGILVVLLIISIIGPEIGIKWPIESPLLSAKDQQNPRLRDIPVDTLPRYE